MAEFTARVLDPTRREVLIRTVRAESEAVARQRLQMGGHLVLDLVTTRTRASQVSLPAVGLVCRELLSLLQAGLTLVEALEAMASAPGADPLHGELLERLQQGKSLSVAMQEQGGLPPLLVASVRASERTSDLPAALAAYLRFDGLLSALRQQVISAAMYPSLVVALGGVITVFLLLVVIPRFARLFGETAVPLSAGTRAILAVSAVLADRPWLIPLLLVSLLFGAALAWKRGWLKLGFETLVERVTLLRRQVRHYELARIHEALTLLVRGGYSLHEALTVVRTLPARTTTLNQLALAQQGVANGASVSQAFFAAGMTDPVTLRLIRAGERGGQFDRVLAAVAERHRQAFETFVQRATRIVEPVLLLLVAVLVGALVLLLYMPVFDIASSVQ